MHMKEVTDEDPFRIVKPLNQSRAEYARRESSMSVQIKK